MADWRTELRVQSLKGPFYPGGQDGLSVHQRFVDLAKVAYRIILEDLLEYGIAWIKGTTRAPLRDAPEPGHGTRPDRRHPAPQPHPAHRLVHPHSAPRGVGRHMKAQPRSLPCP